jgi:hypothetical protein
MILHREGLQWTCPDTHVCELATKNILSSLSSLENQSTVDTSSQPRIILLSTTGISSKARDIPITMMLMYHWMLVKPHADKMKMEEVIVKSGRRWVCVRPSFLVDGTAKGKTLKNVRVGWELPNQAEANEAREEKEEKQIGYTIGRQHVGLWIYEECINGDFEKWEGTFVTLTY